MDEVSAFSKTWLPPELRRILSCKLPAVFLHFPLEEKGPWGPFYQLRRVLAKGRHLLQILLKAVMKTLSVKCASAVYLCIYLFVYFLSKNNIYITLNKKKLNFPSALRLTNYIVHNAFQPEFYFHFFYMIVILSLLAVYIIIIRIIAYFVVMIYIHVFMLLTAMVR